MVFVRRLHFTQQGLVCIDDLFGQELLGDKNIQAGGGLKH